jgi:hypothetical protein
MNRIKHYSTNDGDFFLFLENIFSSGSFASARGFFIKTIRTQHFKEIQDYFTSVVTNLYETKDRTHHGRVTLLQIQQAMLQIDHHMDILQINQQIYKTLGLKNKIQINWNEQIDYIMFLKEMSTKNVLKYTLNYDPNAEINMQKRPIRSHLIMQSAMNKIKAIMTTTKAITEPENKE